jgi:hypothetical protein
LADLGLLLAFGSAGALHAMPEAAVALVIGGIVLTLLAG